jgi:CheY-like chemotaxis protein
MIDQMEEGEPYREDLSEIAEAGRRAAELTKQLLTFSRRQGAWPRKTNLNDVVRSTEKMLRRVIGEDICLECCLSEDLANIKIDPNQMEQVLMNLAVNSRDAMPDGGKIELSTRNIYIGKEAARKNKEAHIGEHVCLSFKDSGTGIDSDVAGSIFEPFFTTKELGKGTGLGLSVVYGIAKQYNGWIELASEKGKGTEFIIYFPRSNGEDEHEDQGPETSKDTQKLDVKKHGILLVEDENDVQKYVNKVLTEKGYIVYSAANAEEAWEAFEKHRENIDIVFTDVILPGESGLELAKRITNAEQKLPIVLGSGYTTDMEAVRASIASKGYDFIQKPYKQDELVSILHSAINQKKDHICNK